MAAILGEDEMTGEDVLQEMIGDGTDPTLHIPGRVGTPLSLFRAFLLEKDVHPTVETTYSSEELDGLLTRFYTEMKRVGGQHYADGTVSSIRSCLQKHFLRLRNEDIIQDEKYSTSNKMYEKIVSQSRKREMRNPKEKVPIQAIEPDDVDKLYNTVFSTDSPRMLQQKTLFEYIYYFCHRGLKHLRCIQKEDFAFHRDASGREYVTVREKNDKPGKILMQPVRMYERPGDPMCPVASLKKYLMKLSPENPFFWQRPRKICYHSDAVWYKNSALGKNALSALMMNLSIEASLSKRYSNSNIRASNIPRLDNQSWEASVTPTVIGCETDQSAHRSPYPDCQDYFVISVERDPPYETDPGHQDSCENCDNERDTCTPIETDLGQQESCSDNKTDTTRRNKYRNVLFGAAANAWKQLIGRFDWLHDSEIAQHLIQVHEVHCMSKGICPLVRPPDTQNSELMKRTRKSGEVPILELKEEEEDISLQYEVEEADSVDEDSSDESDLEMGEVSDLEMGEEIALKDEPVYSMDNAPPNPGSTQQADNSVSHRNQEAAISWGANPFQASTVVNPNSAENYSNTENSTVTNMTSSSLYKPTGVKQEPFDNFTVNNTGTNDLIMRSAFTSPNVYESSSTHFANAVGIPEVIGQKAANKETRINVAQKPLIAAMLTNFGTVEASQVQRSQPLGLNSAHCINNVVPQNDLLTSGQRGSTWNIKRENTPNSVVVHSQDPELFQPVSVSAVGVHQISPEADEGGQQISPEADVRGQQISPESDVRGQQISPEAYVRGHQISPEADEGGQQISPEADVRGQQISPEAYVRGQQISPEADEGGQQTGGKKSRNKKRKRLQGPYMLWVNTNRDKIMKHYPELDFQGFGRLADH
ncbi:uncharacterized protein LOC134260124 [Saccostrea cucullata]|uniref:uncharacterized protein LOC134260124 n=1 Tax=Saccostrea cuccullata TaxID=36930 RepID=UPI002ED3B483